MAKAKQGKLYGVSSAFVCITGNPDEESLSQDFNHAKLTLMRLGYDREEPALSISFQRHILTFDEASRCERERIPESRYDYGKAWSVFYSPSIEAGRYGRFKGPDDLMWAAKVVKKIEATIREYNLWRVHSDALSQWLAALEKLKVGHREERYWNKQEIGAVWQLPEEYVHPAAKLIERAKAPPAPVEESA